MMDLLILFGKVVITVLLLMAAYFASQGPVSPWESEYKKKTGLGWMLSQRACAVSAAAVMIILLWLLPELL